MHERASAFEKAGFCGGKFRLRSMRPLYHILCQVSKNSGLRAMELPSQASGSGHGSAQPARSYVNTGFVANPACLGQKSNERSRRTARGLRGRSPAQADGRCHRNL